MVIFFTWQVRPQLGNVLYTEHTNKAKIPSNPHYVGGVHKKVHITSVPLQQWHEEPNSWLRLWDEMKDWRLWVTGPQQQVNMPKTKQNKTNEKAGSVSTG